MTRANSRFLLAPPIAAALILTALSGCSCNDKKCCDEKCSESAMTMDQLPAPVAATLSRESAGGTVKEIEKEMKNGKTIYSADIVKDDQTWDIAIAEDGTVISKELEK